VRVEVIGLRVGSPLGAACPCYAVSDDSTLVLLDFGPGALERVWDRGLLGGIDAIVISHMHLDHMLDLLPLSGELTRLAVDRRRPGARAPQVYVPRDHGPEVLAELASAIGSTPGRFGERFDLREYDDTDAVEIGGLRLTFARTDHPVPCFAPRITDGRSTLVYGADGAYSDALVAHASAADLLLLEATYLDDGPEVRRNGHLTGEQAATVATRAGARGLVLTHVGPWPEDNDENLRRTRALFAGEVELAHEGAVYTT
jgi:ribonuclease BN (tRNA processing enzyme)